MCSARGQGCRAAERLFKFKSTSYPANSSASGASVVFTMSRGPGCESRRCDKPQA